MFRDLKSAIEAGWHVYDRLPRGYLVRKLTDAGFVLAIVEIPRGDEKDKPPVTI